MERNSTTPWKSIIADNLCKKENGRTLHKRAQPERRYCLWKRWREKGTRTENGRGNITRRLSPETVGAVSGSSCSLCTSGGTQLLKSKLQFVPKSTGSFDHKKPFHSTRSCSDPQSVLVCQFKKDHGKSFSQSTVWCIAEAKGVRLCLVWLSDPNIRSVYIY